VYASDSGQPLRRAQVRIISQGPPLAGQPPENRLVTTDATGRYEFANLRAGRYSLNAQKGSYVGLQWGQQRPNEPGKPLQILDAQTIEKVDFSLPRGGVITGVVVDEFGEPTADVMVSPERYRFIQGRRRLEPTGRFARTNDIGEYRLFGLPPGQYYIATRLQDFQIGDSDERSGYAPTYYPGTGSAADAQRVTVGVGQVITDINISLVVTATARVSGLVVDADGKPVHSGVVAVMQRSGGSILGGMGGQIRPDGTFVVSNLAAGEYTLEANTGDGTERQWAKASITVAGEDVSGLRLAVVRPAVANGRIVSDTGFSQSTGKPVFRLMAEAAHPDDQSDRVAGFGSANDDSTFRLRVQPCTCVLRIGGAQNGWYLKTVKLNGSDVTDSGIDFRADQQIDGIEIAVTDHPSEISGAVTDDRGNPSTDYTVVVFSQDREKLGAGSRYSSIGRPDQNGRYRVRGLPAGSYYAIALDSVDTEDVNDPDYLDQIRPRATSVSLNDGETKTLDLKLTGS